jgi:calcium/calmodulin-dependent protein kinase I
MLQILEGCKIMHREGVIHRDLKPDNLMFARVNDKDSLSIVDFGLATLENEEKYSLQTAYFVRFMFPKCGTPGFVAPEILNLPSKQSKYSSVSDIFSVGCIFHKL